MDRIRLDMPFDLVKSGRDDEMRIGGYASTPDRDRQNESVMQKSLDISEFVESGFFNLDHDGSKILGYPDGDRCLINDHGLYVEGTLLNGVPEAESVYRTAVALKKSNTSRRLGFSVEGRVLERDHTGLITKAKVYNVAITAQPVNPKCTWEALCKSFAPAAAWSQTNETENTYAETEDMEKALETSGTGEPLIRESLETAFRNLADIIGQDEDAAMHLNALKEILRRKDHISKSELTLYFTLTRGLPLQKSRALVEKLV